MTVAAERHTLAAVGELQPCWRGPRGERPATDRAASRTGTVSRISQTPAAGAWSRRCVR